MMKRFFPEMYIRFTNLGTPLTYEYYCNHIDAACYATGQSVRKFNDMRFHPESPIRNLYFAGADVFSLGILGSFAGGLLAATKAGAKKLFW